MAKRWLRVFWAVVLLAGCDDGGSLPKDGGADSGSLLRDAGDGGSDSGSGNGKSSFGSRCAHDTDCGRLFCDSEIDLSFSADNLPAGESTVPQFAFPGGICTPVPAAPYTGMGDSCDPTLPQASQGCGTDGVCVPVSIGQDQVAACRPHCDPAAPKNQCGRTGYTCDFDYAACMEGCQSDLECRLKLVDTDGDSQADMLVYDDKSEGVCDPDSFRCVHHGGSSGSTGDACQRIDECADDGLCIQEFQTFGGFSFPGGACSKIGCDITGRECEGDDAVCTRLRSWTPGLITPTACFQSCELAAEPAADQTGSHGHGKGCREGYRCHWTGGLHAGEGVCVGGNYNAVTKNNLGAACMVDSDCYSPYGVGRCLSLRVGNLDSPGGTCTLMDCAAPGMPDDLCGPEGECVGLSGDVTFCVKQCKEADQCADGFGCTDDDGDPTTSKVCYPVCQVDEDCRKGSEVCDAPPATMDTPMVGHCVASGSQPG